jgi:flagellar hook-length control protein FliK
MSPPASAAGPALDSAPTSFEQLLNGQIAAAPAAKAAPRTAEDSAATSDEQLNTTDAAAVPDMLALLMGIGALHTAPIAAPMLSQAATGPTPGSTATPNAASALPEGEPRMSQRELQMLIAKAPPAEQFTAAPADQATLPTGPQAATTSPMLRTAMAPAPDQTPAAKPAEPLTSLPATATPALLRGAERKTNEDSSAPVRGTETPLTAANLSRWPEQSVSDSPVINASASIAHPVTHAGWDQAISQRVLWMAQDKLQSATLTLNPPQLGPLQVTLQIENQQATVQFVAASPQTQQALQDALPVLRDMLGQSGIALGQADVSAGQHNSKGTPFAATRRLAEEDSDAELAQPGSARPMRPMTSGRGLINLFA